jgi:hypothetical protein
MRCHCCHDFGLSSSRLKAAVAIVVDYTLVDRSTVLSIYLVSLLIVPSSSCKVAKSRLTRLMILTSLPPLRVRHVNGGTAPLAMQTQCSAHNMATTAVEL